jgi:ABC-type multidrug transport system fused ATPase/permease subunit
VGAPPVPGESTPIAAAATDALHCSSSAFAVCLGLVVNFQQQQQQRQRQRTALPLVGVATALQGWFYRELRQSLVDMEDLFRLLRTPSQLPEGSRRLPDTAASGPSASGKGAAPQADEQLTERRHSNGAASARGSASSSAKAQQQQQQEQQQRGLRLELRDAHFSYAGRDGSTGGNGARQVLRGVSLTAEPGESIAVVGQAGRWKGVDVADGVCALLYIIHQLAEGSEVC